MGNNNNNNNNGNNIAKGSVKAGISFGSALAMVVSYANWHAIGWAILHGILGWIYIIYYIIKYGVH